MSSNLDPQVGDTVRFRSHPNHSRGPWRVLARFPVDGKDHVIVQCISDGYVSTYLPLGRLEVVEETE